MTMAPWTVSTLQDVNQQRIIQSGARESRPAAPNAVVPAVNQVELHPLLDQTATLEYCARRGIVVEAYGAIGADGLLEQPTVQQLAPVAELQVGVAQPPTLVAQAPVAQPNFAAPPGVIIDLL